LSARYVSNQSVWLACMRPVAATKAAAGERHLEVL